MLQGITAKGSRRAQCKALGSTHLLIKGKEGHGGRHGGRIGQQEALQGCREDESSEG